MSAMNSYARVFWRSSGVITATTCRHWVTHPNPTLVKFCRILSGHRTAPKSICVFQFPHDKVVAVCRDGPFCPWRTLCDTPGCKRGGVSLSALWTNGGFRVRALRPLFRRLSRDCLGRDRPQVSSRTIRAGYCIVIVAIITIAIAVNVVIIIIITVIVTYQIFIIIVINIV
jgi:hypothetical protein